MITAVVECSAIGFGGRDGTTGPSCSSVEMRFGGMLVRICSSWRQVSKSSILGIGYGGMMFAR